MESPEDDDEDDGRRLRIPANDQEVCYSSSAFVCGDCYWEVAEAWYVTTMINLVHCLRLRILEDEHVQSRPWMASLW